MHLKGDEPALGQRIVKIGNGHAVDPTLKMIALGNDLKLVPLAVVNVVYIVGDEPVQSNDQAYSDEAVR